MLEWLKYGRLQSCGCIVRFESFRKTVVHLHYLPVLIDVWFRGFIFFSSYNCQWHMLWLVSLVLQGVVNGRLGCDIGIEVNHGVISNTLETCACHNRSKVGVIYLPFHENLRRSIQQLCRLLHSHLTCQYICSFDMPIVGPASLWEAVALGKLDPFLVFRCASYSTILGHGHGHFHVPFSLLRLHHLSQLFAQHLVCEF